MYNRIMITRSKMVEIIQIRVNRAGTQAKFAREAGIHASQLSEVLSGFRAPTPSMLAALGYRRAERYEKVRDG